MLKMEMDKGINKTTSKEISNGERKKQKARKIHRESPLLINFPILICMLQHINMKTNIL